MWKILRRDDHRRHAEANGPTITAEEAYWIPQHIFTLSSVCVTTGGKMQHSKLYTGLNSFPHAVLINPMPLHYERSIGLVVKGREEAPTQRCGRYRQMITLLISINFSPLRKCALYLSASTFNMRLTWVSETQSWPRKTLECITDLRENLTADILSWRRGRSVRLPHSLMCHLTFPQMWRRVWTLLETFGIIYVHTLTK